MEAEEEQIFYERSLGQRHGFHFHITLFGLGLDQKAQNPSCIRWFIGKGDGYANATQYKQTILNTANIFCSQGEGCLLHKIVLVIYFILYYHVLPPSVLSQRVEFVLETIKVVFIISVLFYETWGSKLSLVIVEIRSFLSICSFYQSTSLSSSDHEPDWPNMIGHFPIGAHCTGEICCLSGQGWQIPNRSNLCSTKLVL